MARILRVMRPAILVKTCGGRACSSVRTNQQDERTGQRQRRRSVSRTVQDHDNSEHRSDKTNILGISRARNACAATYSISYASMSWSAACGPRSIDVECGAILRMGQRDRVKACSTAGVSTATGSAWRLAAQLKTPLSHATRAMSATPIAAHSVSFAVDW